MSFILEDESCWVDIAVETVKMRILSTDDLNNQISRADAERHFISMIKCFNDVRHKEMIKRSDEWSRKLEEGLKAARDPQELEKIKNYALPYKSSSSGCMLVLPIMMCCFSALFYLIILLL